MFRNLLAPVRGSVALVLINQGAGVELVSTEDADKASLGPDIALGASCGRDPARAVFAVSQLLSRGLV